MVQAARSGVQNIAEGSLASATSKRSELKLTNVARASLEELRLDYEDFLRQRSMNTWGREEPRRQDLIDCRCKTADEVVRWVRKAARSGLGGQCGRSGLVTDADREDSGRIVAVGRSTVSMPSTKSSFSISETAANAILVLLAVACGLLDRQIESLAKTFEREGGFTERLYRVRSANRNRDNRN